MCVSFKLNTPPANGCNYHTHTHTHSRASTIAQDVNRDSVADTKVGTLDYFAPEVLDLRQGETYDATQAVRVFACMCECVFVCVTTHVNTGPLAWMTSQHFLHALLLRARLCPVGRNGYTCQTIIMPQDMWSLGVTLYAMLCRGYPYRRRDDNPTTNQYQFVRTMLDVRWRRVVLYQVFANCVIARSVD